MKKLDVWTAGVEAMNAFAPYYRETMQEKSKAYDMDTAFYKVVIARGMEPKAFTPEAYDALFPYGNIELHRNQTEELVEKGIFTKHADGYRLTEVSRKNVESIFHEIQQLINSASTMPSEKLAQLASLLKRIVKATQDASEPAKKFGMKYSQWTDPGDDSSPAAQIDQYLTDLYRFRDDAHLAAWLPYGVDGVVWDTMTQIWNNDANTLAAIAERLEYRGYTTETYAAAIDELVKRGWITTGDEEGSYVTTPKGKELRDQAEDQTNAYFFVGWDALSDDELKTMHDLFVQLRDSLAVPEEAPAS